MIPILYPSNETTFTNNGIGRLSDCISCEVTEERNGEFEVEFRYPINGIHYDEIEEEKIILVDHDEQGDAQPFVIYRRSAPINGIVSFFCHHISYRLSAIVVEPFTASSVADAFNTFTHSNMNPNPFTFWTDNSTGGTMKSEVPASVRSLLGGTRGSVLDVFGGEYLFDKFLVRNYAQRGSDKGVTIRYGKNLTNIVWELDTMDLYGSVVPFWSDGESTVVYGGIVSGSAATERVTTLDLSSDFDEPPTVAALETRAAAFLASNTPWIPKENIKIDFVPLWQTDEYADVAPLERVCLCDTVTVYYTDLGVQAKAKVIKVVWDALIEKYTTIELGQAQSSFADTIIGEVNNTLAEAIANVPTTSAVQAAIDNATSLITGGMGGHICFLYDADGKPTDMLVMDTEDVNTAIHVLRINVNGIGFSSTGVSGTYTSAWTLDGSFVADFITSGYLNANRIHGGTLTLGGNNNGNGVLVVYNASGTEIGRWDKDGIKLYYNDMTQMLGSITYTNRFGQSTTTAGVCLTYDTSTVKTQRAMSYMQDVMNISALPSNHVINNATMSQSYGQAVRQYILPRVSSTYVKQFFEEVINRDHVEWRIWDSSNSSDTTFGETANYAVGKSGIYYNYTDNGRMTSRPAMRIYSSSIEFYAGTNTIYLTVNSSGGKLNGNTISTTASSERYKHDITNKIDDELDAHRLYKLEMKQFVYNDDHKPPYPCMAGKTVPGFIAEDVEKVYPAATIYNEDGKVESWSEAQIIPGMLKLIQEQHDEIENLKARLAKLEAIIEKLI